MISINRFYAFNGKEVKGESAVTTNISSETLSIQVDGLNGTLEVWGCVDLNSDNYYKLSGFDADFNIVSTISADGIYSFAIEDVQKFKFKAAGNNADAKVFCKMAKGV